MHTFFTVWWLKGERTLKIPCIAVIVSWVYALLFAIIDMRVFDNPQNQFYLPVPVSIFLLCERNLFNIHCQYWCWVAKHFLIYRIFGQWIWMWIALFLSIVSYMLLGLWSMGFITVKPNEPFWKFHIHKRPASYHLGITRRRSFIMILCVQCSSLVPGA